MTKEELEAILEGGTETISLDFKSAMQWDVKKLAKDFLAFANVQDGGTIVIGVREESNTYVREGVSEEQKITYNTDRMRDDLRKYADPYVSFTVEFPVDRGKLQYVVIKIREFDEIPVVCACDSEDTKATRIYFRNRNRRIESAPVSNSNDLRDIVERAGIKMMQRFKKIGLSANPSAKEKLDKELGGL